MITRLLARAGMVDPRSDDERYTPEIIRSSLLHRQGDPARVERVRDQLERLPSYLHDAELTARFRGLESYHGRMPALLSMYLRGKSIEQIAAHYRPVLTPYGVERAFEILFAYMALRLNETSA